MSEPWLISLLSVVVGVVLGFTLNQLKNYLDESKREHKTKQKLIEALHQEIKRNLTNLNSANFLELAQNHGMEERLLFLVPLECEAWIAIKRTDYLDNYDEKLTNNLNFAYGAIHQYNRTDILNEKLDFHVLQGLDQLRLDISDWLEEASSTLEEKQKNI